MYVYDSLTVVILLLFSFHCVLGTGKTGKYSSDLSSGVFNYKEHNYYYDLYGYRQ